MSRMPWRALAGAALATLALMFLTLPVRAVSSPLQFSDDGRTWSSTSPSAILGTGEVLVPGSAATGDLHIRSAAPTTGTLELALRGGTASDSSAARAFGLAITAEHDYGEPTQLLPRTPLADLSGTTRLGQAITLEPGESVRLGLVLDLDAAVSGRDQQGSTVGLSLTISFRDATGALAPVEEIPALPVDDGNTSTPPHTADPDGVSVPGTPPTAGGSENVGTGGSPEGTADDPDRTSASDADGDRRAAQQAAGPDSAPSAVEPVENPAAPVLAGASGPLAVTGFTGRVLIALAAALILIGLMLLRSRYRKDAR
ncbi:hypothetical protein ACTXJ3_00410 [Brachybacterium paraconglomeratum]|uniref:hypothetical protein n=1 Tax=Brachybacterium paraconglomeratum TaxID=173362 RepID=UPI003FD0BC49